MFFEVCLRSNKLREFAAILCFLVNDLYEDAVITQTENLFANVFDVTIDPERWWLAYSRDCYETELGNSNNPSLNRSGKCNLLPRNPKIDKNSRNIKTVS